MADSALLAVRYDHTALQNLSKQVAGIRSGLARVVPRALNRTAAWTNTRMKREVARQCKLKVARAARVLRVKKASSSKLNVQCEIQNRRAPIGPFAGAGRRGRAAGALTVVFPSGQRMAYPYHFRATMSSGHKGVFVRGRVVKPGIRIRRPERVGRNKWGWYKYRTELPIYEQMERLETIMRFDWLAPLSIEGERQLAKEITQEAGWIAKQSTAYKGQH